MSLDLGKQTNTKGQLASLFSIWKFFGGIPVLKGVDIDIVAGEVHALLGGNGSGKSTLMKILSGAYQKDSGNIIVNGQSVNFPDPQTAHSYGIYLVPQEPKIFPNMTVFDNIICGMKVKESAFSERVEAYARDLGFEGSIMDNAYSLSIANQQLLEIIRGLVRDVRILILDEPTSTLAFKEVSALFERIKILTKRGIGVFFISHRINEIFEISDRISVLRDGNIVFTKDTRNCTAQEAIKAMLPALDDDESTEISSAKLEAKAKVTADKSEAILRIEHLSGYGFSDVSFSVYEGEVLGLAGVVGAGRTELAHAVIGLDPFSRGKVVFKGVELKNRSPLKCLEVGLGYVPEDRYLHGIFLDLPNKYTITAAVLSQISKPLISKKKEENLAREFIKNLNIKANSADQISRTLSGGNQQKVVLAKILSANPSLVILDEPTRGVDAKARLDIYKLIRELQKKGTSIILISSDLQEIIQESSRILVMHAGRIAAEFKSSNFDLEKITSAAFGLGVSI
jgi:AI-2 transport system ATP-binding protein